MAVELTVAVVPGGHSVLWSAADETAAAIGSFLSLAKQEML